MSINVCRYNGNTRGHVFVGFSRCTRFRLNSFYLFNQFMQRFWIFLTDLNKRVAIKTQLHSCFGRPFSPFAVAYSLYSEYE